MKLTGKITSVGRQVAKANTDGSFDEKRVFTCNVRPASKLPPSHYGYGALNFTLHGRELADFGADLNDEVDVFLVRKGEPAPSKLIDDVSHALYIAEAKIADLETILENSKRRGAEADARAKDANGRGIALQQENVRLTTELATMKAALAQMPAPAIDMLALTRATPPAKSEKIS